MHFYRLNLKQRSGSFDTKKHTINMQPSIKKEKSSIPSLLKYSYLTQTGVITTKPQWEDYVKIPNKQFKPPKELKCEIP